MEIRREDIVNQISYIIEDYLESNNFIKTLNEFKLMNNNKVSSDNNTNGKHLFEKDKLNSTINKNKNVIEYMIKEYDLELSPTEQGHKLFTSTYANISTATNSISNPTTCWDDDGINTLKQAIKIYNTDANIKDKQTKWKCIRKYINKKLDRDYAIKACYEKYKELKKEKKNKTSNTVNNIKSTTDSNSNNKEKVNIKKNKHVTFDKDILVENIEDENYNTNNMVYPMQNASIKNVDRIFNDKWSSLSKTEILSIKEVCFRGSKKTFPIEWIRQGLTFNQSSEELKYGLIQNCGGPCGILAVVQAYILLKALSSPTVQSYEHLNEIPFEEYNRYLSWSLAHIIWKAKGTHKGCIVALTENNIQKCNDILDHIKIFHCLTEREAEDLFFSAIPMLTEKKGPGLVCFFVSLILSRGPERITTDMDVIESSVPSLVGEHNYCTQELVNLLIHGIACSNVFDGQKTLCTGDITLESKDIILRGITKQSEIGFLSLFEAYQCIYVGSFLKYPANAIWIVCSESHYSVLFSFDKLNENDSSIINLYYYDQFANQQEPIKFTLTRNDTSQLKTSENVNNMTKNSNNNLIPPLNKVLLTRWVGYNIDWNGTEPML